MAKRRPKRCTPLARISSGGLGLLLFLTALPAIASTPATRATAEETVLFAFDDHSIPFFYNLQLSMEPPGKFAGNPVLSFGSPGQPDEWQLRYYTTILRVGGKFMMWYLAMSREAFVTPLQGGPFDDRGMRFGYAESEDGIHWRKPNLGLVEFRGNRNNNLIEVPKGVHGYDALVRYDPDDADASRRFKMMCLLSMFGEYSVPGLAARGLHRAFVPMYSPDGLRWRIADELLAHDPKVISPEFELPSIEGQGFYRWGNMYYLAGQGGPNAAMAPYGRHIQIVRSPDLLHWSSTSTMGFARQGQFRRSSRVLTVGPDGAQILSTNDNEQAHAGVSVWNRGNVLIGVTGLFHGAQDWNNVTHDLGFLISNDGLHFREPEPDFVFAKAGEDGRDWDQGGLIHGEGFANVGDKSYIWYSHMEERAYGPRTGGRRISSRTGGVGLLIADRDRFGSLSVRDPNQDGEFITAEIPTTPAFRLAVNAEGLGPESPLQLELLDALERPIPDYSGPNAATLTGSGLSVPVRWGGKADQVGLSTPFKIRVRFKGYERNAIRLYAIYIRH